MRIQKKYLVLGVLIMITLFGVAAIKPKKTRSGDYKNLMILPADISSKKLTKIMIDGFEDDLGVSCNFCHAENKETHKPDYASDEKPEKEIARAMMRMTLGINKKYFKLKQE